MACPGWVLGVALLDLLDIWNYISSFLFKLKTVTTALFIKKFVLRKWKNKKNIDRSR